MYHAIKIVVCVTQQMLCFEKKAFVLFQLYQALAWLGHEKESDWVAFFHIFLSYCYTVRAFVLISFSMSNMTFLYF